MHATAPGSANRESRTQEHSAYAAVGPACGCSERKREACSARSPLHPLGSNLRPAPRAPRQLERLCMRRSSKDSSSNTTGCRWLLQRQSHSRGCSASSTPLPQPSQKQHIQSVYLRSTATTISSAPAPRVRTCPFPSSISPPCRPGFLSCGRNDQPDDPSRSSRPRGRIGKFFLETPGRSPAVSLCCVGGLPGSKGASCYDRRRSLYRSVLRNMCTGPLLTRNRGTTDTIQGQEDPWNADQQKRNCTDSSEVASSETHSSTSVSNNVQGASPGGKGGGSRGGSFTAVSPYLLLLFFFWTATALHCTVARSLCRRDV